MTKCMDESDSTENRSLHDDNTSYIAEVILIASLVGDVLGAACDPSSRHPWSHMVMLLSMMSQVDI